MSDERLTKLANKLFEMKPDEKIVKSLIGEVQIPHNDVPNIFKSNKDE